MTCRYYNSLAFIRRYYHIPASQKLSWALIVETVHGKPEIRLGVLFCKHPHLYLDVAMRRFFTVLSIYGGAVTREVYPAQRIARKEGFLYYTGELSRLFPKSYIGDIYYPSVYSAGLIAERQLY